MVYIYIYIYIYILEYIKNQEYYEKATKNDKKTIKCLSMNFFLNGEVLYKRG